MACEVCRYWARMGWEMAFEHHPVCPNITEADLQKLAEAEDEMPVGVWAAGALADAGLIK